MERSLSKIQNRLYNYNKIDEEYFYHIKEEIL